MSPCSEPAEPAPKDSSDSSEPVLRLPFLSFGPSPRVCKSLSERTCPALSRPVDLSFSLYPFPSPLSTNPPKARPRSSGPIPRPTCPLRPEDRLSTSVRPLLSSVNVSSGSIPRSSAAWSRGEGGKLEYVEGRGDRGMLQSSIPRSLKPPNSAFFACASSGSEVVGSARNREIGMTELLGRLTSRAFAFFDVRLEDDGVRRKVEG